MEPEHKPLPTTTFPWATVGIVVGVVLALPVVLVRIIERTAREPSEVVVVESAPVVKPEVEREIIDVPAARPSSSTQPLPVPWPPGESRSRSSSNGTGRQVVAADLAVSSSALDVFFGNALVECNPTRAPLGKSIAWTCETASNESRALIVPRTEGSWLRTSMQTFTVPDASWRRPTSSSAPSSTTSCGWTLGFVALPEGSWVSSSGGSGNSGHCTLDVEGPPERAWSTMLRNIFRPGTTVAKRAVSDDNITRWTAEAWDGDAWWRLDVVTSARNANNARVHVEKWAPEAEQWAPPVLMKDKLAAIDGCWEPCALALKNARDVVDDNENRKIADRCLYECRGVEQGPAKIEAQ